MFRILTFLTLAIASTQLTAQQSLFESLDGEGRHQPAAAAAAQKAAVRTDQVQALRFNRSALSGEPGTVYEVPVAGQAPVQLRYRKTITHNNGLRTWVGDPVDGGAFPTLITVTQDGGLAGRIRSDARVIEIHQPRNSEPHVALAVARENREEGHFCGTDDPGHAIQSHLPAKAGSVTNNEPTTLGVVVGYANAPAREWGGNVLAEIQNYVDTTNIAYEDSGVAVRIELKDTLWIGLDEDSVTFINDKTQDSSFPSTNVLTNRRLSHHEVSGFRDLDELRNAHGAHLAPFLAGPLYHADGLCGFASGGARHHGERMWLTSWTNVSCQDAALTFAHELGHNLGAHHSENDASWGNYTAGYKGSSFRTIMSLDASQPRIARFSNPDLECNGEPCGTGVNDSARGMGEAAELVEQVQVDRAGVITDHSLPTGQRGLHHQEGALDAFDRTEFTGGWATLHVEKDGQILYELPRMPFNTPDRQSRLHMPLSLPPTRQAEAYTATLSSPTNRFDPVSVPFNIYPQAPGLVKNGDGEALSLNAGQTSTEVSFEFWGSEYPGEARVRVYAESSGGTVVGWDAWPELVGDAPRQKTFLIDGLDCETDYTLHYEAENWTGSHQGESQAFTTDACGASPGSLSLNINNITPTTVSATVGDASGAVKVQAISDRNLRTVAGDAADTLTIEGLSCSEEYEIRAYQEEQNGFARTAPSTITTEACDTPSISLAEAAIEVDPEAGVVSVPIQRDDAGHLAADVLIRTIDGSAVAGEHYGDKYIFVGWEPGDTQGKELIVPIHPLAGEAGEKQFDVVLLEATSPFAATIGSNDKTTVTINEQTLVGPTAGFSFTCSELDCSFDGASSLAGDRAITDWEWDFGDGATASGEAVSHSYAADGTYTVTLTVTDSNGESDTDSQSATVAEDDDGGGDDGGGGSEPGGDGGSPGGCALSGTDSPWDPLLLIILLTAAICLTAQQYARA